MDRMRLRTTVLSVCFLLALAAHGQPGEPLVVSLAPYDVWCTEVAVPDGADQAAYFQRLAAGVGTIDRALGMGASTGTPFAARSRKQAAPVGNGAEPQEGSGSVVTVCARVAAPAALPPGGKVFRETRRESVFARECPIAAGEGCLESLRAELVRRLALPADDERLQRLFWRATATVREIGDGKGLAAALLAPDRRRVHPDPLVDGDRVAAAELSKPIEEQTSRPLLVKRPSWLSLTVQPDETWLVVAITLSPEMIAKLAPGQPE